MEYLIWILIVVAIIALLVLAKLLYNVTQLVKSARDIMNDNKRSIDISILEVSRNLEETTKLLKTINLKERELRETMDNVQTITSDVATVTTTVAQTVEKGEEIIATANDAFQSFGKINKVFNKGDSNEKSK